MSGRRKRFDTEEHRARYAAAGTEERLILNLLEAQATMRSLYEGKASQRRTLILLRRIGPITQKALTERLEVQPATVSGILRKMEEGGLILRRACGADQRTATVLLTLAGERQAEEAAAQRQRRHREMFSCLSPEEKQRLLSLLEKVNADWKDRYGE